MDSREIELNKLGFEKNEHQQSYGLYKFNTSWYVDFWYILEYSEHEWHILMSDLKYDIEMIKSQSYEALKVSDGYKLAQKENKKKLVDKYNHLNSLLTQAKHVKLTKIINDDLVRDLTIQVKLLKELIDAIQ